MASSLQDSEEAFTMQQQHAKQDMTKTRTVLQANSDIPSTSTVLQAEVLTGVLPVLGAGLAGEAVASEAAFARTSALAPLELAWVMASAKVSALPADKQRARGRCACEQQQRCLKKRSTYRTLLTNTALAGQCPQRSLSCLFV
jgi:hypothetical protein